MISKRLVVVVIALSITAPTVFAEPPGHAFRINRALGRGVNLGNMLEAPREGAWGLTLKPEYFQIIKEAGFDSVRIPIRWSAHAQDQAPFAINEEFFQRMDGAIDQALAQKLVVVINVHHYEEIFLELRILTARSSSGQEGGTASRISTSFAFQNRIGS
jgi:endoglucanase